MSDSLRQFGFDVNTSAWSNNDTAIEYQDILTNNQTAIHNLVIFSNDMHFNARVLDNEEVGLVSRNTVLRTKEIEVYYHASGQCYTTHTKAQVAVGIEDIIARVYHNDYYASCWALRFGTGS
ncbi:hypothetical protein N7495_010026 [Penicillium taxi]|uniref:uncharacterized protein n=1 Tax=Penicillium taxi TaxID=168475 RepID=UPI002544E763|nr:uncharacterized protein N7495_010026 [Penicillium taxi]KAJ5885516.1 hypothetical protein N7495_010026 [Penicillium taxi]